LHPPTHALLSWILAEVRPDLARRDRALILAAGLVPDLDGLAILSGAEAYGRWHHTLLHNAPAALATALVAGALAARGACIAVFGLALAAFHLHLLCDLVGSAGPGGSLWSIPYLVPLDPRPFYFRGQWELASWQNVVITVAALLASIHLGVRRGRTLVEALSTRADAAVVDVLRRRWPFARGSS
jgi:hypothetical protein